MIIFAKLRCIIKWFKHLSGARNGEKIARLEDKCGLEGYGFYFKMLEIVAGFVDESDCFEVTYSVSRWGRQTNISTKKFLYLTQCCADVGLMLVQRAGDDMLVKIPNILKYRDNHTKNLQATGKQEQEKELDKDKDKDIETYILNAGEQDNLANAAAPLMPQRVQRVQRTHRVQREYTPSLAITAPVPDRLAEYTPSLAITAPVPDRLAEYTPSLAINKLKAFESAMDWVDYFVNEKGFQRHQAQTAKTVPMYLDWVERGVTVTDLELAMVGAHQFFRKPKAENPTGYRKFVDSVLAEKHKSRTHFKQNRKSHLYLSGIDYTVGVNADGSFK